MNKKIMLSGIIFALSLLLINSAFALTATNTDPTVGTPGATVNGSFILTDNVVGTDVTAISYSVSNLVGVTDITKNIASTVVSFSPVSPIATLADSTSATVTTSVVIPSDLTLIGQTYQGTVTINANEGGAIAPVTFALSVVVNSPLEVQTYSTSNPLEIIGEEGQAGLTSTFILKNIGTVALSGLTLDTSTLDLSDSDSDTITLSFSALSTLNAGASQTITATVNYAQDLDLDTYGGIVKVKSGSTVLDTFDLDLKVFPNICEDGIVSDGDASSRITADLDINTKEPDTGDDFKAGDSINVEVKVENDGDDDLNVVVEAILYDLDEDEEITTAESDSEEIKDGNSETFEFELEVPKSTDLDVDNRYVMFIKVYEDGDEDQNCNFDSVNLDFKRDKNDVVVDEVEAVLSTVKPGESVDIRIDIQNEGTKNQEDVYVKLINTELGINKVSTKFDLDKAGDSDDDIVKRFTVEVPTDAVEKDYLLEVAIYDDDDDVYDNGQEFVTLTVKNGGTTPVIPGNKVSLNVASNVKEIEAGAERANLHFVFTNNEASDVSGTISISTVGDWAEPILAQTVNLHPGENNLYFDLKVKDDVSEGMHSATVSVKPTGYDEQSYSFNFDVKGKEGLGLDIFSGEGSTLFWIIGDIVLIVVALFFIKAIFFGRKLNQ